MTKKGDVELNARCDLKTQIGSEIRSWKVSTEVRKSKMGINQQKQERNGTSSPTPNVMAVAGLVRVLELARLVMCSN